MSGEAGVQIDWNDAESVVRAAVPNIQLCRHEDSHKPWELFTESPERRTSYARSWFHGVHLWMMARKSQFVVAFELQHNPAYRQAGVSKMSAEQKPVRTIPCATGGGTPAGAMRVGAEAFSRLPQPSEAAAEPQECVGCAQKVDHYCWDRGGKFWAGDVSAETLAASGEAQGEAPDKGTCSLSPFPHRQDNSCRDWKSLSSAPVQKAEEEAAPTLERICQYIESEFGCLMPIVVGETKHDYGMRLLKTMAQELRTKFITCAPTAPVSEGMPSVVTWRTAEGCWVVNESEAKGLQQRLREALALLRAKDARIAELECKLGPLATGEVSGISGGGLNYMVGTKADAKLITEGLHAREIEPQLRDACRQERDRADKAEAQLSALKGQLEEAEQRITFEDSRLALPCGCRAFNLGVNPHKGGEVFCFRCGTHYDAALHSRTKEHA